MKQIKKNDYVLVGMSNRKATAPAELIPARVTRRTTRKREGTVLLVDTGTEFFAVYPDQGETVIYREPGRFTNLFASPNQDGTSDLHSPKRFREIVQGWDIHDAVALDSQREGLTDSKELAFSGYDDPEGCAEQYKEMFAVLDEVKAERGWKI